MILILVKPGLAQRIPVASASFRSATVRDARPSRALAWMMYHCEAPPSIRCCPNSDTHDLKLGQTKRNPARCEVRAGSFQDCSHDPTAVKILIISGKSGNPSRNYYRHALGPFFDTRYGRLGYFPVPVTEHRSTPGIFTVRYTSLALSNFIPNKFSPVVGVALMRPLSIPALAAVRL
jgi:hypothetical protein